MSNEVYINPLLLPTLTDPARFNIIYGGRNSGKSTGVADILLIKALAERNATFLAVKGTMRSINDSVKSLLELRIIANGWENHFRITDKEIICITTGSKFIFAGLLKPERIKSMENVKYLWIEEATVDITEKALDILFPTIRIPGSKIFITFNPRFEEDAVYKEFIMKKTRYTRTTKMYYYDNPYTSQEVLDFIDELKTKDPDKYDHYFLGNLQKIIEGALWSKEMIHYKDINHKQLDRIVIAIDPAGSDKKTADEAGIIVAGKLDGVGYVLDDLSGSYSPLKQCQTAVSAYNHYDAEYIVIERNGVGAGFKDIIHQIDRSIPTKEVNAFRGKLLRAKPIATLYDQALINHVRSFDLLEFELKTYTGLGSMKSPGRLDAVVYALTELFSQKQITVPKGMMKSTMLNI